MKLDRLVLAFASTLASCGGGSDAPMNANNVFPSEAYVSLTTQAGIYRVEVRTAPAQPPLRGDLDVEVRIVDAKGAPVDGIALGVVPWMPTHAHGTSVVPTVTAEGSGRYHVVHVELFMPGTWQLRMTFGENGGVDHAVVPIDVL